MTIRRARKEHKINESTLQRLNLYALAAGAAGVGLLAAVPPAEAQVYYNPVHVTLTEQTAYELQVGGETKFDISNPKNTYADWLQIWPRTSAFVEVKTKYDRRAPPLPLGAKIGSSRLFSACRGCSSTGFILAFPSGFGSWANLKDRYLGLRIEINKENRFGWLRMSVQVQGGIITAEINGYAFESTPGEAIMAGQTSGTIDDPVFIEDSAEAQDSLTTSDLKPIPQEPPSGSLGVLALGAPGIPLWRRRLQARDAP